MKARLLKTNIVQTLLDQVEENLDRYRSGDFDFLYVDPSSYIETSQEIDEIKLSSMSCDQKDHKEVENCIAIFEGMGNLSNYLARDMRLWVSLVHTVLLSYSRNRWPIPDDDEKAVAHIRVHFFISGQRGFERDNAASRLWWMANLCNRVDGLSLEKALTCFLHDYDTRAGIIERPTTSQSNNLFSSIMIKLYDIYVKDEKWICRKNIRPAMRKLNLIGGTKLIAAMRPEEVAKIVDECISV